MATQISGIPYVPYIITWIALFIIILVIEMKLYSIVKKLQEKYPKKYNELAAEPWFKGSQGNLGIWARVNWLFPKLVFNWNWFPEEIKQDSKWVRVLGIIGFIWILLLIAVIGIIVI